MRFGRVALGSAILILVASIIFPQAGDTSTLESTKAQTLGGTRIQSTVKSGNVTVGDPVTPLTSFQEGTVLMKMANMENLLFKGTVDEIDVGKLQEGMITDIKIGALPEVKIKGTLQ